MTPVNLTSSHLSNPKPAPLDRAKQLAETLLSERGEASGALVARQLHEALGALDASGRHGFEGYLATEFQPDKVALRAAAERYLAEGTAEAAAALAQAADPPRQELLRRMNMAPGGTGALIALATGKTQQEIAAACKGARPNHVGAAIARHRRAGRIEERDGKLYATQSTGTEQRASV